MEKVWKVVAGVEKLAQKSVHDQAVVSLIRLKIGDWEGEKERERGIQICHASP